MTQTNQPATLTHGSVSWPSRLLALPEFNLFVFAFLIHFVYEVWQAPFYDFYDAPTLAGKIFALTHCTFGDGVITLVCSLIVSLIVRSRQWLMTLQIKPVVLFIVLGWVYTLLSEIYRTRIAHLYGLQGLAIPGLGISSLPLVQWLILPPLILWLTRYQVLGHRYARKIRWCRFSQPFTCLGSTAFAKNKTRWQAQLSE